MNNQHDPKTGRFLKQARPEITKSVADVSWGSAVGWQNLTVEGMRALYKSLTPAESYQLSVDLQAAIKARAQVAHAKLRFFHRKSGEEIIGGPLVDLMRRPAPGWTTYRFIRDVISHWHMTGEIAISVLEAGDNLTDDKENAFPRVAGLYPLSPLRLSLQDPVLANDATEVKQWRYMWPNGVITIYGQRNLIFAANFNPLSHVRGMAPVLAGVNEISASYQAIKYNHQFFSNDAMPNHILVLPNGTSQQDKEAFKNQYLAMHSTYGGQAHKVMVIEGGEGMEVIPLEQQVKEGHFTGLMTLTAERIMRLYAVPPVVGGLWDKTKFDSVDVQREVFLNDALMPDMEMLSQVLQTQLVDMFFRTSETTIRQWRARCAGLCRSSFVRTSASAKFARSFRVSRSIETRLSRIERLIGSPAEPPCPQCGRCGPLSVVKLVDDAGNVRQVCAGCGAPRGGVFVMIVSVSAHVWEAI